MLWALYSFILILILPPIFAIYKAVVARTFLCGKGFYGKTVPAGDTLLEQPVLFSHIPFYSPQKAKILAFSSNIY